MSDEQIERLRQDLFTELNGLSADMLSLDVVKKSETSITSTTVSPDILPPKKLVRFFKKMLFWRR
jgi:hypothetical protein